MWKGADPARLEQMGSCAGFCLLFQRGLSHLRQAQGSSLLTPGGEQCIGWFHMPHLKSSGTATEVRGGRKSYLKMAYSLAAGTHKLLEIVVIFSSLALKELLGIVHLASPHKLKDFFLLLSSFLFSLFFLSLFIFNLPYLNIKDNESSCS